MQTAIEGINAATNSVIVRNGCGLTNNGYRQVAFSMEGEIRPVFACKRNGKVHECTTSQSAKEGDLILRHDYFPSTWKLLRIHNEQPVQLPPMAWKAHAALLAQLPKELDNWLAITDKEKTFLPDGCGWQNGLTLSDARKARNVSRLFDGLDENWVKDLVQLAKYAPGTGLPNQWDQVTAALPEFIEPGEYVTWEQRHCPRVMVISETMPLRRGITKLAKIERLCYSNAMGPYGVKWTLYRRQRQT